MTKFVMPNATRSVGNGFDQAEDSEGWVVRDLQESDIVSVGSLLTDWRIFIPREDAWQGGV